jgi:small subunit ribosomal protein S9
MVTKKTETKEAKPKKKAAPAKKTEAKEKLEKKPVEEKVKKEKAEEVKEVAKPIEPKEEAKEVAPIEVKSLPKKEKKPKKGKKAAKKPKVKVVVARGKRKEAIARATIKSGNGAIRINSILLQSFGNEFVREIIREPIRYVGPQANTVNISVNVFGGGAMGQAQAARTAIANALINYFEEANLKEKFISIDRSLVVEDTRRVEPKKYKGPKARARYQKSYR